MPLMGVRQYARHRGVSHPAVLKALRTGRIRRNREGLIDSDQADAEWNANTHPAPRAPRAVVAAYVPDSGFARARTVRAHYEAQLARLDYEERAARLVSASEVAVAQYKTERAFKDHMLRIPDRVVPQLAGESDEHYVYAILASAMREALTEFADRSVQGSAHLL